ncbi:MAG: glycosyltransferase [Thermoproteota archaeon]
MPLRLAMFNHNEEEAGTYLRCFNFAKNLVANYNYHVLLITISKKPSFSISVKKIASNFYILFLPSLMIGRVDFLRASRYIYNALMNYNFKPDIIHSFAVAHLSTSVPIIVHKLFKDYVKKVVDWDDLWGRKGIIQARLPVPYSLLLSSVMTSLEEGTIKSADHITAISSYLYERASQIVGQNKVTLLFSGSDTTNLFPMSRDLARELLRIPKKLFILSFEGGSLVSEKHIIFLFETLRFINKNALNNTKLFLIGVRINTNFYYKIMRSYNVIRNNVVVIPRKLPLSTLNIYLNASDVLLLPTLPYPWDVARWPGRFGDYLAVGKPIATTSFGDPAVIVKQNGLGRASISKPEPFAEAIEELLSLNSEAKKGIEKSARKLAEEKFSWNVLTEVLNALYLRL